MKKTKLDIEVLKQNLCKSLKVQGYIKPSFV